MQEMTPVVNRGLEALRVRAKKREFNFMRGWRALSHEQLPSLKDLAQLHASYGPLNREQLMAMLLLLPRSRGVVQISDSLLGAIFDVGAGSYLVTFCSAKRTVRGFVSGSVEPKHCSEVTTSLVAAFETHVMPAKAHAAELLKK